MPTTTSALKYALWQRFGDLAFPAEWDGHVYGGGKLSQRYWEYFITLELLALDQHSTVLDIGGGSPVEGVGFFADLLALQCKQVIVLDVNAQYGPNAAQRDNVVLKRQNGDYESVRRTLEDHPDITHVSCVSVFEHIEDATRRDIVRSLNDHFTGATFVMTLEYHARVKHWEHQLTAASLSELFAPLVNFYPDAFVRSPVYCENAYQKIGFWALFNIQRALAKRAPLAIPAWYPLAVRFVRA